jgi:hypothetical protein
MKKMLSVVTFHLFAGLNVLTANAQGENQSAAITMEKAKQIALEKVKGQVISAKTEVDDGMMKYEIIIQAKDGKYEVEIDKATGKVLEVEKEGARKGNDDGHNKNGDDHHEGDDDHHEGDDDRYDD